MLDRNESEAPRLAAADPLLSRRDAFVVPPWPGGSYPEWAYFAGNSLGLMPRSARAALEASLARWGSLAIEGWFEGAERWLELAGSTPDSITRRAGADGT